MSETDDSKSSEGTAPRLPTGWGDDKTSTVKRWSEAGRGDDPEARQVHAPLSSGVGDGKAFFFLFGFRRSAEVDRKMLEMELAHIEDDIEALRKAGYTVVVDRQATKRDFFDMLAKRSDGAVNLEPVGFYWSAHGNEDGSIQCCDGEFILPSELDGKVIPSGLRLAVMAACYVGARARTWRKALGGRPLVVGWGRPVTIDKAVDFLEAHEETATDFDDLLRRFVIGAQTIPGDGVDRYSPADPACAHGHVADLPARVERLVGLLGGAWRQQERYVELRVPLETGRHQVVRVFVTDSDQAFCEGEPLLGVESDVGELSALVDPATLLAGLPSMGYVRVALVRSATEFPNIVTQGFLPAARVRDRDLAALVYQVAAWGDELERRIFGGDMR
jgi:hypothetical protein